MSNIRFKVFMHVKWWQNAIELDMSAYMDCHGMTAAHILCKNSANRMQWSLLNIAEV